MQNHSPNTFLHWKCRLMKIADLQKWMLPEEKELTKAFKRGDSPEKVLVETTEKFNNRHDIPEFNPTDDEIDEMIKKCRS